MGQYTEDRQDKGITPQTPPQTFQISLIYSFIGCLYSLSQWVNPRAHRFSKNNIHAPLFLTILLSNLVLKLILDCFNCHEVVIWWQINMLTILQRTLYHLNDIYICSLWKKTHRNLCTGSFQRLFHCDIIDGLHCVCNIQTIDMIKWFTYAVFCNSLVIPYVIL